MDTRTKHTASILNTKSVPSHLMLPNRILDSMLRISSSQAQEEFVTEHVSDFLKESNLSRLALVHLIGGCGIRISPFLGDVGRSCVCVCFCSYGVSLVDGIGRCGVCISPLLGDVGRSRIRIGIGALNG